MKWVKICKWVYQEMGGEWLLIKADGGWATFRDGKFIYGGLPNLGEAKQAVKAIVEEVDRQEALALVEKMGGAL